MRFIKKHGLTKFKMNPHFPVNTVQIMRGAVAAEMDGQLAKYVEAVFRHMWEEGKKMDDPRGDPRRARRAPASTARACWRASRSRT